MKSCAVFCLIVSLITGTAIAAYAEGPSITEVVYGILHDQGAIATSPLRANSQDARVWIPAALTATSLAVRWNTRKSVDERIASHYADASGSNKDIMNGVTQLGNGAVPFGLAVLGYGAGCLWRASPLAGRWGGYDQLQSFSARWFEALADVSIWGEIIKIMAGRSRPESAPFRSEFLGPSGYFKNSGKNSSFVSGHATVAFASAAVISREFPAPWVAASAYLVAGGVGFSRVYLDKHWTSDVIMGAALGQSIGALVENRHRKMNPAASAWRPWIDGEAAGLVWTRKF